MANMADMAKECSGVPGAELLGQWRRKYSREKLISYQKANHLDYLRGAGLVLKMDWLIPVILARSFGSKWAQMMEHKMMCCLAESMAL